MRENLERVAVKVVVASESLYQQPIAGQPDRPAPITVATEEIALRFARVVVNGIRFSIVAERERVLLMIASVSESDAEK